VDDILVLYHRKQKEAADKIIKALKETYELQDKGEAEWFLGIRIVRDRPNKKIYLCHDSYLEKYAVKYDLNKRNWFPTIPIPVAKLSKREDQASPAYIKSYQEKVGSLLYTAVMVRPDVAFAVSQLSKYLTNLSEEHHKSVDQALRYLYVTRDFTIAYRGNHDKTQALHIASDASFADNKETRRSSQGYLITLFSGAVMWKATRQSTVLTSTIEAELIALKHTAAEAMGLQRFLNKLRFYPTKPYTIHCNNQQTIRLVIEPSTKINTRLRHVEIQNM
ncbi:hypothetical protein H9Q70_014615, partial [Fusarium xylarioides]